MNRQRRWWPAGPALWLVALVLTGAALAQVSDHFDLSWHLLSSGGGVRISNTRQINDSLGQPTWQTASGTTHQIEPGFWHGSTDQSSADAYEVDDHCGASSTIPTDGSTQDHTFHDHGDEDWARFDTQAGRTYVIQAANVGDRADLVAMLYDACNDPPFLTEDNAFGSTIQLEWTCSQAGTYYLRLRQHDPALYGAETDYQLSIAVDATPPAPPRNPRALPADQALVVQWDQSPEPDVAGYRLWWGTSSGPPYSDVHEVDGAETTFHELTGLTNSTLYYLALTARDVSGNESAHSVEIAAAPVPSADDTTPDVTIDRPSSADVYATTLGSLTVGGACQDAGGNLSRVRVRNTTLGSESWDYGLSGGTSDFSVEGVSLTEGENQIAVTVFDGADNSGDASLTIRRLSGPDGAVVIVGGRNNSHSLQSNIDYATNRAYRIFRNAGYDPADIRYLSPAQQDADGDGQNDVYAATTPANIQAAIQWAAGQVGPGQPFYLYLMDHGGIETFCGQGCTTAGRIASLDLDAWLTDLETTSGCDLVTVILDACHSGSFIDRVEGIAQSISQDGRVIIASTGRTNNAYASAQGAYFSDSFFSAIAESSSLLAGFNRAKADVELAPYEQTPWLDDNGDALFTEADGVHAANRYVAGYFGVLPPEIIAATLTTSDGAGSISAQVARGDEPVALVWAAVYAPSYQPPGETTLDPGVPLVRLPADPTQPGRYSAVYNGFGEPGTYRVIVYAQDRAGEQAQPRLARPGGAWPLFLPLIAQEGR